MSGRIRSVVRPLFGAALVAATLTLGLSGGAEARTSVSIGIGVPVGPVYPYPYYRPHYYYPPPPVVYAPPPEVVYAPPPVVYAPPAAAPALAANPTGPAYVARNGQLCREYQSTIVVGGVQQPSYGTACQQPDGTWRVVN